MGISTLWFALGTLISRMSGVIRESVLAGVFGTSSLLDAFFVANRIPNMLREMVAEGALGSSFTKVFSQHHQHDKSRALALVKSCINSTSPSLRACFTSSFVKFSVFRAVEAESTNSIFFVYVLFCAFLISVSIEITLGLGSQLKYFFKGLSCLTESVKSKKADIIPALEKKIKNLLPLVIV